MREHLVFLLAAPMASFGGYAGHERRGTEPVPMRSAVLGLLGAALGVDRTDAEGQTALRAYRVAVEPLQRSVPLRDYHTVQTVPTAKVRRPATRRQALERIGRDANTVITVRDYRCDVLVGVAVWGGGRWTLDELADRIRRPRFPLYLGRKSCPPASPLDPRVTAAEGPAEALAGIQIPDHLRPSGWSRQDRAGRLVLSDPVEGTAPPPVSERLPNEPIDRGAWTFAERSVWHLSARRSRNGDAGGGA